MNVIPYLIMSVLAIGLGQLAKHLNLKLPPVVSEEITYPTFFKTFTQDFKVDIKYSAIFLVIFNSLIYTLGSSVTVYLYAIIVFALAIVISVDIRFQLIPDEVHFVIAACGIIHLLLDLSNWWQYLLGAVIGGAIFWGLGLLSLLIFKKEGMGFGDVKLMAVLGLMFGMKDILVITLVSFVVGAIIGGILLIAKKKESDGYIPFGPFIALGAVLIMFVPSQAIIDIYITFCTWLGMQMSDGIFWVMDKLHLIPSV